MKVKIYRLDLKYITNGFLYVSILFIVKAPIISFVLIQPFFFNDKWKAFRELYAMS